MVSVTPLISIIIPNWNNADLIGQTLDSIISQTYTNWECIIVDDVSDDNSKEIVEAYNHPKIEYIERNRSPKGASTCRNIGAARAKGDYLIFLDSDDLLAPHCLETRHQSAKKHPDFDFYIYPVDSFSSDPSIRHEYYREFDKELYKIDPFLLYLSSRGPFQTTCFFWKSSFFNKIGGFNEAFPRAQDAEISLRAFYDGKNKLFLDFQADCHYRNDPKSNRKSDDAALQKQKKEKQLIGLKLYSTTSYDYTIKASQHHPENKSLYWQMFQMQPHNAKGFFKQNNYWLIGYFKYLFHLRQLKGINLQTMTGLLFSFISNKAFVRAKIKSFKKQFNTQSTCL